MGYLKIRILFLFLLLLTTLSCTVSNHYKTALTAYEIGEYHKSIASLRKVYTKIKDRQRKGEIQFKIAEAYYKIGQYRQSESYFKSAMIRNTGGSLSLLHYAEVLRANGKYDEAISNYKTYLDSVPGSQMAINGIESAQKTSEWLKSPTRYKVENLKEINSSASDYAASYAGVHDNEIYFTSSRKGSTGKIKSAITGEYNADIYILTLL